MKMGVMILESVTATRAGEFATQLESRSPRNIEVTQFTSIEGDRFFIQIDITPDLDAQDRFIEPEELRVKDRNEYAKRFVRGLCSGMDIPRDHDFAIHMAPYTSLCNVGLDKNLVPVVAGRITLEVLPKEAKTPIEMPDEL